MGRFLEGFLEGFWRVLEGSWRVLGGFWEGFGRVLGGFWRVLEGFGFGGFIGLGFRFWGFGA